MRRETGTSYWIDTPRSPASARRSQSAYWTTSGRLRPSASRRRTTASGLPSVPMMISAGSPGSTRITTNTSAETKKRVATSVATRLSTYRRTRLRDQPGYLVHATSERSADGIGRSFHRPWSPFFATTSRGCMKSHTAGASSTSIRCSWR